MNYRWARVAKSQVRQRGKASAHAMHFIHRSSVQNLAHLMRMNQAMTFGHSGTWSACITQIHQRWRHLIRWHSPWKIRDSKKWLHSVGCLCVPRILPLWKAIRPNTSPALLNILMQLSKPSVKCNATKKPHEVGKKKIKKSGLVGVQVCIY